MKLLSIVVPTKNRKDYLFSFINMVRNFSCDDLELIIHDNSDDDSEIQDFVEKHYFSGLRYFHYSGQIDMVENSERAIEYAEGKYVCFMGDDDVVTGTLFDYVKIMDAYGLESSVFSIGQYDWPGVERKVHSFQSLRLDYYTKTIHKVDLEKETKKFYCEAVTRLNKMPQLYHGVIRRDKLERIKEISGSYFPGPCPDMAVAVGLISTVKEHYYFDAPLLISGTAPKSASGLGAKHQHKGDISTITTLPKGTADVWDTRVPKIWTGPTIYAETACKALTRMGKEDEIARINLAYLYAKFYVFHHEYIDILRATKKYNSKRFSNVDYLANIIKLFVERCVCYVKNIFICKFSFRQRTWKNIDDSEAASLIIERDLGGVDWEMIKKTLEGKA